MCNHCIVNPLPWWVSNSEKRRWLFSDCTHTWFSFVHDMDPFIIEHRAFLYEFYVKSNSTRNSQRKFRTKFPGVPVPHRNTIQNLIRTIGMLTGRKTECQHQVLTEQKLQEIRAWAEHSLYLSCALHKKWEYQKGPQEPWPSYWNYGLNKTIAAHSLQPCDPVAKFHSCGCLSSVSSQQKTWSWDDTFYLNGHIKTQSNRDWRVETPHFMLKLPLHK
jgi:hypothetical protein